MARPRDAQPSALLNGREECGRDCLSIGPDLAPAEIPEPSRHLKPLQSDPAPGWRFLVFQSRSDQEPEPLTRDRLLKLAIPPKPDRRRSQGCFPIVAGVWHCATPPG